MKPVAFAVLALLALLATHTAAAGEKTEQVPAATATPAQKLDINRATAAELLGVPGIGPRTAQAIVELRAERGSFRALEDLLQVRGIKEKTLTEIAPFLMVAAPQAAVNPLVR